jgi:hypothetical protein
VDGATVSLAVVASRTEAELIAGMLRSHGMSAAVSAMTSTSSWWAAARPTGPPRSRLRPVPGR